MALRMMHALFPLVRELRYEPTEKHVRAALDGRVVVDSRRAVLVWEPQRIVPSYAVPVGDVRADLAAAVPGPDVDARPIVAEPGLPPVYDPGTSFRVHTCEGQELTVRSATAERNGAAFRPADPDLSGHVLLDFFAFDQWWEEEEPIVAHPRDPFKRIDVRRSHRHVRIEHEGELLAESTRPQLLFETFLPVRYYLPRDDVRMEVLCPTSKVTHCAYKGEASYWSAELDGRVLRNVAWCYENPLSDAVQVRGLVAFFNERVDVIADGRLRERPQTAWS
jgi:uncharacterized protein (DUF427 family)